MPLRLSLLPTIVLQAASTEPELLGPPDDQKRFLLTERGHSVPREDLIRETLAWLDQWLGGGGS